MTKGEINKIINQAVNATVGAAEKRLRGVANTAVSKAERRFQRIVNTTLKASEKRFKRYIGAQKEHFDDKVKAIGEQYSSIKATQDEHTQILIANQETLLEHDAKLSEMQSTLKRIETKLDTKADQNAVDQIERPVTALEANR